MDAMTLRKYFCLRRDEAQQVGSLPDKQKGAIVGVLEKASGGKVNRKLVLKFLTGKESSKQLTDNEWHALNRFVLPHKDAGGRWGSAHGMGLVDWCATIAAAQQIVEGQLEYSAQLQDLADHG